MKRKNCNRFVDDDEFEVADILLQIPHIIFESESLLPRRSLYSPANQMGNLSAQRFHIKRYSKKEDLLKMVGRNREYVKLLCSMLKALNLELKARKQQVNFFTLVPSTTGSNVAYPIPGSDLSPSLDLNLNIALNFDTTQLKRVTTAQARKKRLQIYKVKEPKDSPSPSIISFG
ncbi:hypothetical protein PVL29_024194 [Vitis rotundifolia]|uniref:Uncharacterized protein n=1 Tax=Vitis rotundifolia TaxID=103349 RepID=A0AA39D9H4_VITRO|nr:hypothetical protein PVL29_024194 [Vitis rotundifolia]